MSATGAIRIDTPRKARRFALTTTSLFIAFMVWQFHRHITGNFSPAGDMFAHYPAQGIWLLLSGITLFILLAGKHQPSAALTRGMAGYGFAVLLQGIFLGMSEDLRFLNEANLLWLGLICLQRAVRATSSEAPLTLPSNGFYYPGLLGLCLACAIILLPLGQYWWQWQLGVLDHANRYLPLILSHLSYALWLLTTATGLLLFMLFKPLHNTRNSCFAYGIMLALQSSSLFALLQFDQNPFLFLSFNLILMSSAQYLVRRSGLHQNTGIRNTHS